MKKTLVIDDRELYEDKILPVCGNCKHLYPEDRKKMSMYRTVRHFRCNAFPKGVPYEILMWKHDHREPYKGDNGIRFEPIKE